MRETWVQSLGWEDPLEKGKATHSSILVWRIPWPYSPWGRKELDTTERLSHWWLSSKEFACQCKRCRFNPLVKKIPCRRKWQPTLVFKSHGQRSLASYNSWSCKRVGHGLATNNIKGIWNYYTSCIHVCNTCLWTRPYTHLAGGWGNFLSVLGSGPSVGGGREWIVSLVWPLRCWIPLLGQTLTGLWWLMCERQACSGSLWGACMISWCFPTPLLVSAQGRPAQSFCCWGPTRCHGTFTWLIINDTFLLFPSSLKVIS